MSSVLKEHGFAREKYALRKVVKHRKETKKQLAILEERRNALESQFSSIEMLRGVLWAKRSEKLRRKNKKYRSAAWNALKYFRAAHELDPMDLSLLEHVGLQYVRLDEFDRAIVIFGELARKAEAFVEFDTQSRAFRLEGEVHEFRPETRRGLAKIAYTNALDALPDGDENLEKRAELHEMRARVRAKLGENNEAPQDFVFAKDYYDDANTTSAADAVKHVVSILDAVENTNQPIQNVVAQFYKKNGARSRQLSYRRPHLRLG